MLSVVITAPTGAASIGTAGLMDALVKADRSWRLAAGSEAAPLFDVTLAGLDDRPIPCRDGVFLQPHRKARDVPPPDLVIVPALDDEDHEGSFAANRGWGHWIETWYRSGARIASSCTGAFLVADTGLLDGRRATTQWLFAERFHACFPNVTLASDQLIVDTGDIISSGGATAFLTLVLYLVERFRGHERAALAAKVMLVDGNRTSQLPYVAFSPDRDHNDELVRQIQDHIAARLGEPLRADELAARFGLSVRTLARRFDTATGRSPQSYVQHARIEEAKRLLETTAEPVDRIRSLVGYRDPAAFRRAFREVAGLSPRDYRARYGPARRAP